MLEKDRKREIRRRRGGTWEDEQGTVRGNNQGQEEEEEEEKRGHSEGQQGRVKRELVGWWGRVRGVRREQVEG